MTDNNMDMRRLVDELKLDKGSAEKQTEKQDAITELIGEN
jgi:hypothetical protein